MASLEQWQQAITQNIANASVIGYKRTEFGISGDSIEGLGATHATSFNERLESILPMAHARTDFAPGEFIRTGVPTDFAIQGRGFFEIERPDSTRFYTRDGQFHIDPDYQLVSRDGQPVMGTSGAFQLVPGAGEISLDREGNLSQGVNSLGRLLIVEFDRSDVLERVEGGFVIPADGNAGHRRSETAEVLQGYTEGSNVSAIAEMVSLITAARAFEANQRIISSYDEHLESMVRTLGVTS